MNWIVAAKHVRHLLVSLLLLFFTWSERWSFAELPPASSIGAAQGIIVFAGCGDSQGIAEMGRNGKGRLIHCLDQDPLRVAATQKSLDALAPDVTAFADVYDGTHLPYIDNSVNLLIAGDMKTLPLNEVMRVLVPNGVAFLKKDNGWERKTKPWPEQLDEWTHFLYDSSGNAVSRDSVVAPPRHLQWLADPLWARHHDRMASLSAMATAGGRIFYIIDEGPKDSILLPPRWRLAARDAFNGVVLWTRDVEDWYPHLWPFKSGPALVSRRLVVEKNRVYVTLGLEAPVSELDAVTGKTLHVFAGSEGTEELIQCGETLYCVINPRIAQLRQFEPAHRDIIKEKNANDKRFNWNGDSKRMISAFDTKRRTFLWKTESDVVPMSLAADSRGVFFHDGKAVTHLAGGDGARLWRSDPVSVRFGIPLSYGANLIIHGDTVVFAGGDKKMTALNAKDGKHLWQAEHPASGHNSAQDLFVIDNRVWSGDIAVGASSGRFCGYDLRQGTLMKEFLPDVKTHWFHHRCYRSKATTKYILTSRTGVEFIDPVSGHWEPNHWVRGGCINGVMPANGLLYAPPHSCACYTESKLNGFSALAPTSTLAQEMGSGKDPLTRGPAYEDRKVIADSGNEWPTYRGDNQRSGFGRFPIQTPLRIVWQKKIASRLSSPTVAGGKVFVSEIDRHAIHAIEAKSGEVLWTYRAGGRVDSPPTIHQGSVYFGSRDGYAYCLRASDGALRWRFRAAPIDRRLQSTGQLESVWPVHGSVLVVSNTVYCLAGRSIFLDGGMRLYRLDPVSGESKSVTVLDEKVPGSEENVQSLITDMNMPVALPDILSSDGYHVFMRSQVFNMDGSRQKIARSGSMVTGNRVVKDPQENTQHLFSVVGFLDDSFWHRSLWLYGCYSDSGPDGWFKAGRNVPYGNIMVFNETDVYGYGRKPAYVRWVTPVAYHIFSVNKAAKKTEIEEKDLWTGTGAITAPKTQFVYNWSKDAPIQVQAAVLTDSHMFIAGSAGLLDEEQAFDSFAKAETQAKIKQVQALRQEGPSLLQAISTVDGEIKSTVQLPSIPVFDGMAAAGDSLYAVLRNGIVVCLRKE